LDKLRDPETGEPRGDLPKDVISCGSYAESSQSGTGYRVFGTGKTNDFQHKENGVGFEVYGGDAGRFLIVTGNRLPEAPDALADITELASWLHRSKLAKQKKKAVARDFKVAGLDHRITDLRASLADGVSQRSDPFQGLV